MNGADPSRGALPAADLNVRRAINQSARLELARIGQRLDYYGQVVNWVPVLSMAALRSRVGSLLDIGASVESTYDRYQASALDAETQLSLLDSALTHLQTKVTGDKTTIAADHRHPERAGAGHAHSPRSAQQSRPPWPSSTSRSSSSRMVGEATGARFSMLEGTSVSSSSLPRQSSDSGDQCAH